MKEPLKLYQGAIEEKKKKSEFWKKIKEETDDCLGKKEWDKLFGVRFRQKKIRR